MQMSRQLREERGNGKGERVGGMAAAPTHPGPERIRSGSLRQIGRPFGDDGGKLALIGCCVELRASPTGRPKLHRRNRGPGKEQRLRGPPTQPPKPSWSLQKVSNWRSNPIRLLPPSAALRASPDSLAFFFFL